jgi:DNA polymerase-3 subunit gamma/tau
LTRLKLAPDAEFGPAVAETEKVRGASMAKGLSMATLTRAWQMLLKGIGEARSAPSPLQAAEMVLIRLAFAAELPSPAEALDGLRDAPRPLPGGGGMPPSGGYSIAQAQATVNGAPAGVETAVQAQPQAAQAVAPGLPRTFEDLVALFAEKREAVLAATLAGEVHLVHYEAGRIEFRPEAAAPADLATRMSHLLGEWTGRPWLVGLSRESGAPTLRQQSLDREIKRKQDAASHPLVQSVLAAFPGATIEAVRDLVDNDAAEFVEPDAANGEEE